jgi:hypothetical protein
MMAYGKNETAARLSQLMERPRNLALTGPLMSILINVSLVLVAIAGVVVAANGSKAGQMLVFAAMIWSSTHTLLVRAKHSGNAPLDERERVLANEAGLVGGYTTSSLVAIWFLLLGAFADNGMWFPQQPVEWQALGFFVIGLTTQITNIAAAWRTPAYSGDLMDED